MGVESVVVSVAVDRRAPRLAPPERGKGATGGSYTGLLKPPCRLFKRDGFPSLQERDDEERVVVGVRAILGRLDAGDPDAERFAAGVEGTHGRR